MPDILSYNKLRCLILVYVLLPYSVAVAQKPNLEILQELAVECLEQVPDSSRQFILKAPPSPVFIRSELVNRWQAGGYTLFISDTLLTAGTPQKPVLSYSIENASISYERLKKKRVQRNIAQTIHFTFTSPDGVLIKESTCTKNFTDAVARRELSGLESEAYPQTRAPHPPASWFRRYLEPAVLATATTLGVYLFFTLRSDSNDDGT